jgi:hypothetical protein
VPDDNESLVRVRAERLSALAARQREGSVDAAALGGFLSWQLERELGRLRTGMYRSREKS